MLWNRNCIMKLKLHFNIVMLSHDNDTEKTEGCVSWVTVSLCVDGDWQAQPPLPGMI